MSEPPTPLWRDPLFSPGDRFPLGPPRGIWRIARRDRATRRSARSRCAMCRLVEELGERGVPVFRTDLVAFPQALTLDARLGPDGWDGVLATPHREVRPSEIRSVWYRHPSHFELPEGLSAAERRHAAAEARCGFAGVLSSLDEVLWVNYPARESDALKPRQLHVARRCGLAVPDSVVTNKPDSVREFACTAGEPLAGKTLTGVLLVESGRIQIAYTRRIELATERLAANGYTPTLAALDGSGGYPPGAPYDRIIATCSVPAIPPRGWSRPRPAR